MARLFLPFLIILIATPSKQYVITPSRTVSHPALVLEMQHRSSVSSVAFSPDQTTIASASFDRTVKLWDARTRVLNYTLVGHTQELESVAYSPDSSTLASVGGELTGEIFLWNAHTGEKIASIVAPGRQFHCVAFSPNGSTLVIGGGIGTGLIEFRHPKTLKLVSTLNAHDKEVQCIAFSPDDKWFASSSFDNTVTVWNARTREVALHLKGHSKPVMSVAFSPDATTLASASDDGTVNLWDVHDGKLLYNLSDPGSYGFQSVTFSPDGNLVAGGNADNGVRVWDASTSEIRMILHNPGMVRSVAYSPDGAVLACGSSPSTVALWDAATGDRLPVLGERYPIEKIALSPEGSILAAASWAGYESRIRLWDTSSGELKRTVSWRASVLSLAYSPDGTLLAVGGIIGEREGRVLIFRTDSYEAIASIAQFGGACCIAFSSDNRTLATVAADIDRFYLWDTQTGKPLGSISNHRTNTDTRGYSHFTGLTFSPDNKKLAVGTGEGLIYIYDSKTCSLLATLRGHEPNTGSIHTLIFTTPTKLVTGSHDGTIRIWDLDNLVLLHTLQLQGKDFVNAFHVSPDGMAIAAVNGDGTLTLWDANTGRLRQPAVPVGGDPSGVAFLAGGRQLITGSKDGVVRVWNSHGPDLLASLLAVPSIDIVGEAEADKPIEARAKPAESDLIEANNYIITTPEGYYAGSAASDRSVRFRIKDELYPAECFQRSLFRPDLVARALKGQNVSPTHAFKGSSPPRVQISGIYNPDGSNARLQKSRIGTRVTVTLTAYDDSVVKRLALLVNGARANAKPIEAKAKPIGIGEWQLSTALRNTESVSRDSARGERSRTTLDTRHFTFDVRLPRSDPTIRLQAFATDDDGLQSPRVEAVLRRKSAPIESPGRLLGLCVGVSRYARQELHLKYAADDALALAAAFNKQSPQRPSSGRAFQPGPQRLYTQAMITTLTDRAATKNNIRNALDHLVNTTMSADTVAIFLSGHGWRDTTPKGNFYFAPYEVSPSNIKGSSLAWTDVAERLSRLSGRSRRVLVMLDACHSGSQATNDQLVRALLDANAGVMIIASSEGQQRSLELDSVRHGAFTTALLEALDGKGIPPGERRITVPDLVRHISFRVRQLTKNDQTPHITMDFGSADAIALCPSVRPADQSRPAMDDLPANSNEARRLLHEWLVLNESPRLLASKTLSFANRLDQMQVKESNPTLAVTASLRDKSRDILENGLAAHREFSSLRDIVINLNTLAVPPPDRRLLASKLFREWVRNEDASDGTVRQLARRTMAFSGLCVGIQVTEGGVPDLLHFSALSVYDNGSYASTQARNQIERVLFHVGE